MAIQPRHTFARPFAVTGGVQLWRSVSAFSWPSMFANLRPAAGLVHPSDCSRAPGYQHVARQRHLVITSSAGTDGGGSGAAPPRPSAANEAVLARIRAAQQYKKDVPSGSSSSSGGIASAGSASSSDADSVGGSSSAGGSSTAATLPLEQQQQPTPAEQRSFRTNAGSESEAASWLQTMSSQGLADQIDKGLSAEQFLLAKEELQRRQDVEIITVDAAYAARLQREKARQRGDAEAGAAAEGGEPGGSGSGSAGGSGSSSDGSLGASAAAQASEEAYQPKVATWGVFPRPKDMSRAMGGGRNLKPGQPLESDADAAARQRSTAAALQQYRKAAGLDVDPASEAEAVALVAAGKELFKEGSISAALREFEAASALMPLRSRVGGEAFLQQAICLDSLGRSEQAYAIYTQLQGHKTAPGVAKQAKRMLFGFKAAQNLKTGRLSYAPTTAQWRLFFDRVAAQDQLYLSASGDAQEDDGAASLAGAVAAGVMLLPLAFVLWRVLL